MKYTISRIEIADKASQVVAGLPITDPPWVVSVEQQKSRRSLDQNALLWKWYDVIRQHMGDTTGEWYSAEQVHEYFKAKFLPSRVVDMGDGPIRCRATTTKLSVEDMHKYMEKIDRYCADRLHLILPVRGDE